MEKRVAKDKWNLASCDFYPTLPARQPFRDGLLIFPLFLAREKEKKMKEKMSLTMDAGDTRSTNTASPYKNTASSSTIRFLGILKQPSSDSNPFELDESDVVWSPDFSDSTDAHSQPPPTVPNSPINRRLNHQFHPGNSGLSAALADDHHPLVRRKSPLNPSLSAASAARTIPPVAQLRSEVNGRGKFHQSAPVNVPKWPTKIRAGDLGHFDEVDEEEVEGEMVPPHEIVARSHVTFSVFEGVGRTLKGRDLRRVRNAVFQKTGFID